MDEARFGLHTELRRVWTVRGKRPVVSRQIQDQWDYLDGALSLIGGEAHFAHVPGVGLDWDASDVRDLAASAPEVTHGLVRDQAGFASLRSPLRGSLRLAVSLRSAHLRDGDPRLPAPVRGIDLPPYCPELNPCEQLWDILKDDIANQVFPSIQKLRAGMKDTLRRFWESARTVPSLIGREWFTAQLNASPKSSTVLLI